MSYVFLNNSSNIEHQVMKQSDLTFINLACLIT